MYVIHSFGVSKTVTKLGFRIFSITDWDCRTTFTRFPIKVTFFFTIDAISMAHFNGKIGCVSKT